jgi:hypothetical protein
MVRWASAADVWLLGLGRPWRALVLTATVLSMVVVSLPKVPRPFLDYSDLPLLRHVTQRETYGTDTIADMYEARVVLHDVRDMYTKRLVDQTAVEAATWSKEASAPYPPAVLLAEAGLMWAGQRLGLGLYGMVALLALVFLALSLWYALKTRWYVFPLLYLNFAYFSERFFFVQDGSYLVMLVVVVTALCLARAGNQLAHPLMALAITMKLSPLYYLRNVLAMSRGMALLVIAIVLSGLALPVLLWENYTYIFGFNDQVKGDTWSTVGAVSLAILFAKVLWYVEVKRGFDWEDRIGWALVPFALFLAFKMNVARHLMIVLLVPDKRGVRSAAAAVALAVPVVFRTSFNASLPVATVLLALVLVSHLRTIGWTTIRGDLRDPRRTARLMLFGTATSLQPVARSL